MTAARRLVARPVGHLVPAQPGGRELVVGDLVLLGLLVVVGHRHLATAHAPRQLRAVLDDEGVRAHVVGLALQRRAHRVPPAGHRLARGAVDEVQADLLEARFPRPGHGARDVRGVVRAVEHRQHVRLGGLHAERDAREAARPQRGEALGGDRVGVRLRRDLGVRLEAEVVAYADQHRHEISSVQQRRGAPADEDGRRGPPLLAEHARGELDLPHRCRRVRRPRRPGRPVDRSELLGCVGVEVAVAAPHGAERHVHVDAERTVPHPRP